MIEYFEDTETCWFQRSGKLTAEIMTCVYQEDRHADLSGMNNEFKGYAGAVTKTDIDLSSLQRIERAACRQQEMAKLVIDPSRV